MKKKMKSVMIQIDEDIIKRIENLSNELGRNRSQMMRILIESGLEDAEMITSSGIFTRIIFSHEFMSKVKNSLIKGEIFLDEKKGIAKK